MNLIIIVFKFFFFLASGAFNIVACVNHFGLLQSSIRTFLPCPSTLGFLPLLAFSLLFIGCMENTSFHPTCSVPLSECEALHSVTSANLGTTQSVVCLCQLGFPALTPIWCYKMSFCMCTHLVAFSFTASGF